MDNRIQPSPISFIPAKVGDISVNARTGVEPKPEMQQNEDSVSVSSRKTSSNKEVKKIKVNVFPQDPSVSPPRTIEFPQDKIGDKIANDRMTMNDRNNPKAIPDLEGNYLYGPETPQFDQVNSFTVASRTLDMYQNYRGGNINWAFSNPKLTVTPHKQEGKNAYYSRQEAGTNFFYFKSPPLGKTVHTSQSADVVSHELGHATLDGMRPGYLGWDTETMSVHEAFGDITAMLFALQDESNIKLTLEQNGGNFKKESLITRLGEEFGKAIHLEDSNPNNDDKLYLRSMINDFKYSNPDNLPDSHDPDVLTGESHSFSRVLSGAVYDIFSKIYEKNLPGSKDGETTLTSVRDTIGKLVTKSIDLAPQSKCKYKDFALGMIKADRMLNGGSNEKEIKNIMIERNILKDSDISALDSEMASIPSIRVKKGINNASDVQNFLEKHGDSLGIPDGMDMKLRDISVNQKGERIISLEFTEEMDLVGSEFGKYEGHCVDVNGGLTLAFDKSGKLKDYEFDSIDEDKKNDVKNGVLDSIKKDLITETEKSGIFKTDTEIYKGSVTSTPEGKKKIVRIPVIS